MGNSLDRQSQIGRGVSIACITRSPATPTYLPFRFNADEFSMIEGFPELASNCN